MWSFTSLKHSDFLGFVPMHPIHLRNLCFRQLTSICWFFLSLWACAIFHSKTHMLGSLFNKVAVLQVCYFIRKRLQYRCSPVNITKFSRTLTLTGLRILRIYGRLHILHHQKSKKKKKIKRNFENWIICSESFLNVQSVAYFFSIIWFCCSFFKSQYLMND